MDKVIIMILPRTSDISLGVLHTHHSFLERIELFGMILRHSRQLCLLLHAIFAKYSGSTAMRLVVSLNRKQASETCIL